jgi:hypothetical protein
MTPLRAPRVVGVSGGVGTTTLATALRGHDRGRAIDHGVDILVCRYTAESLRTAATAISWLVANGRPHPILAVTSDGPLALRGARARLPEPRVAWLVVLPYVPHWRELAEPLGQVAQLASCPVGQLPKTLRGYGEAVGKLAEAVLRSGLLQSGVRQSGLPRLGLPHPSLPHASLPHASPPHASPPHAGPPRSGLPQPRLPWPAQPHRAGPASSGPSCPAGSTELSVAPSVLYGGAG